MTHLVDPLPPSALCCLAEILDIFAVMRFLLLFLAFFRLSLACGLFGLCNFATAYFGCLCVCVSQCVPVCVFWFCFVWRFGASFLSSALQRTSTSADSDSDINGDGDGEAIDLIMHICTHTHGCVRVCVVCVLCLVTKN